MGPLTLMYLVHFVALPLLCLDPPSHIGRMMCRIWLLHISAQGAEFRKLARRDIIDGCGDVAHWLTGFRLGAGVVRGQGIGASEVEGATPGGGG